MRSLRLRVSTQAVGAAEAFRRISDFARYSELVDVVRAVTVHPAAPGQPVPSDWEVDFRNGILRWSEVDHFDTEARRIDFQQTTGDFEEFFGSWQVDPVAAGCEVTFEASFDFGIPSLAGILEPIAGRVLEETITRVLTGLLGEVRVLGPTVPVAAGRAA
jgi:ribosome-associated toxin RatA of RatAB toxin-antitoxin module